MQLSSDFSERTKDNTDLPEAILATHFLRFHLISTFDSAIPFMYFTESKERYVGIDLDYYRIAMTPNDYRFFIDFIGEEKVGLLPEDFEEIYYPEDEE